MHRARPVRPRWTVASLASLASLTSATGRAVFGVSALLAVFGAGCGPSTSTPAPVATPPAAKATTPLPAPRADGRLPALATPRKYELAFDIDPNAASFSGTARIDVDVPEPTSWIVLHGRGLEVTQSRASIGSGTNRRAVAGRTTTRTAEGGKAPEELVVGFDEILPKGPATLEFTWGGAWDDELSGLYRVKEGDLWYAFTQFEATDARRAFPCFDEPGFKVPFDVRVTAPDGTIALANTPETSHEPSSTAPGKTVHHFAETKPLPTYLVALAVGDFDVRALERASAPPIRIVTTKGKSGQGTLALEATAGLVDALSNWFGIPYPYEKLDIVAVPDFAAGAMENPGLVTFRDELLLLDPERASVRARRGQAMVIAHELAHQWFGNLVTAAWWNDLWLNEGFATWMEWRVVDQWRPAYQARYDAAASTFGIMDVDALASARAVRQPVVSTADAHEAFDGITYEKGAAVLSTIERWIGEDAFKRGVRDYLRDNAWTSVHADRLLSALDRASGKDVTSMASGFLDFPGVPEVTLERSCDAGSRWHAELVQESWRPLGSKAEEPPNRAWTLPVCVHAQGEKKLVCSDLVAGAPGLVAGRGCPSYIHPNAASSYYRFALTAKEYEKLASMRKELDVPERIAVLSNAWAQVRAGRLKAEAMLEILPAFDTDPARQVVEQVESILASMSDVLVDDAARAAFQKYVASRFGKRKKELGWTPKKDEERGSGEEMILRRGVVWAMGDLAEDETTLREADEIGARWLADPKSVDADMATIALDLASRHAGAARLAELQAAIKQTKTREDRVIMLRAMGGFDDPVVLRRALDATLTDEIRAPEVRSVIGAAFARRQARPVAVAWVREHWDDLRKKVPGSLSAGFVGAAGLACTKQEVEAAAAFFGPRAKTIEGAERRYAEAIESASLCSELRASASKGFSRALLNWKK